MESEAETSLDDDVHGLVEDAAQRRGVPFRRALNDLVRAGLGYVPEQGGGGKPFKTKSLPIGKQLVENLDDGEAVLARAEGESHR